MPNIKFNLTSSRNLSLNCKFDDNYSYFIMSMTSTAAKFWKCWDLALVENKHTLEEAAFSLSHPFFFFN